MLTCIPTISAATARPPLRNEACAPQEYVSAHTTGKPATDANPPSLGATKMIAVNARLAGTGYVAQDQQRRVDQVTRQRTEIRHMPLRSEGLRAAPASQACYRC